MLADTPSVRYYRLVSLRRFPFLLRLLLIWASARSYCSFLSMVTGLFLRDLQIWSAYHPSRPLRVYRRLRMRPVSVNKDVQCFVSTADRQVIMARLAYVHVHPTRKR